MDKIRVPASTIEAWSTGDSDPFESELYKKLFEASEQVSREGKADVEVAVLVVSDEPETNFRGADKLDYNENDPG